MFLYKQSTTFASAIPSIEMLTTEYWAGTVKCVIYVCMFKANTCTNLLTIHLLLVLFSSVSIITRPLEDCVIFKSCKACTLH